MRGCYAANRGSAVRQPLEAYWAEGFDAFLGKPVAAVQIFEAVAELLRVEYRYEDEVREEQGELVTSLPEELLGRMKEAVESGHITQWERLIGEIERLDPAYRPLAGQFKRLLLRLDIDWVQKRL